MIQLTDRELGAVLAGLRMYQDIREQCEYVGGRDFSFREYYDIATDGDSFRALDHPEVDDLCERLNNHYPPQIPIEFTECITCGAPGTTFVDGDCVKCNPPIHLSPEFLDGVRTGIAALREGRITPWEDVERELGLDCETCGGSGEIDDLPWRYLPKPCEDCQEI